MLRTLVFTTFLTFAVFSCSHSPDRTVSSEHPFADEGTCPYGLEKNENGRCVRSSPQGPANQRSRR